MKNYYLWSIEKNNYKVNILGTCFNYWDFIKKMMKSMKDLTYDSKMDVSSSYWRVKIVIFILVGKIVIFVEILSFEK
jgi:hypothetical protein